VKTLDELVRDLVREEVAKLLGPGQEAPATRTITDLDRQRAVSALRRAGVSVGSAPPKGQKRAR
jgi:hypothetical protein